MRETVEAAGRGIVDSAPMAAAEATRGYAFLIQLIGYHMWRQSPDADAISERDVEFAIAFVRRDMELSVLESTMRDLSA